MKGGRVTQGHEPWDSAGETPKPTCLEMIMVAIVVIISALFLRNPNKKK